jgi:Co/Zn/Cd efflux system component
MSHAHGLTETTDPSPAFRWAVGFNAGFVVIELIAGLATGSLRQVIWINAGLPV